MAVGDEGAGGGVAGEPCGVLRAGGVRVARAGAPLGGAGSAPLKVFLAGGRYCSVTRCSHFFDGSCCPFIVF